MKKLIICTLGVIGIVSLVSQKEMKLPVEAVRLPLWRDVENHQAFSSLDKVKAAPEKKIVDFKDLEKNYQSLEMPELQKELETVDKSRRKYELMKEFNKRKLSRDEELELTNFIRTRVVLTKMIMEKKIEELEVL